MVQSGAQIHKTKCPASCFFHLLCLKCSFRSPRRPLMRFPVMCVRVLLQWTVVVSLASAISSHEDYVNYLVTSPQKPQLQIGTNFTATCFIRNTTEVTSRDLRWKLGSQEISTDQYTKINETVLNVTITVTTTTPGWLFCVSETKSESVTLNRGKYTHGIFLRKGYIPIKPENLTCVAVQDEAYISPILHCAWEPKHQQPGDFRTNYRVNVHVLNSFNFFNITTNKSSGDIDTGVFPTHMTLEIWVEADNELGKVESEHLNMEANSFTKTNPPANVNTISEEHFPTSLLLNWTRPIDKTQLNLIHEIRFAPESSHTWSYVPQADTNIDIQSFRLQNLLPDTAYVTQVRCKNHRGGYWSEWSKNSTKRTPSSKPKSKPDVWFVMSESADGQQIQLLSKEPELSNGKIIEYQISIQYKLPSKNAVWEKIPVSNDSRSKQVTLLKKINLNDKVPLIVKVTAVNVKGMSPVATMVILEKDKAFPPVQKLEVYPDAGKLFVEWTAPNNANVSEYLVQWTSGEKMDWQRENKSTLKTSIRGKLEKFVRYNVSVFPLYFSTLWTGKPLHIETYLEQAAPLGGPSVKLNGKPGCTEAHLVWEEIPLAQQRGYISNYTIYYSDGTEPKAITVGSDTRSYTLRKLAHNTRYDVWLKVTNAKGSFNGSKHSFTTLNYAPGEIEGIVVGVSLGFLFVVVLIMLICICKRDVIKESFWPQIPNPGASTIGTWTPDCHIKAETSSENCLSGISVLDVDVCDGKSVFEEDKACLPLKKDKYMSEEHSSGIGGSSCMSSPRQSVSDSDEGGDMADTTASTVQYSSVVASSGYKGQTPSLPSQPTVFSRSESTQPLLESEENTDMLSLEGSRHSQRFAPLSHCEGDSDNPSQLKMEHKTLDFCADGEDSEDRVSDDGLSHDWVARAPISSYMPQLGGYRPQ